MAVSVGDAEDEAAERTNASMLMPEMAQQWQDLRLLVGRSVFETSGARRVGGGVCLGVDVGVGELIA